MLKFVTLFLLLFLYSASAQTPTHGNGGGIVGGPCITSDGSLGLFIKLPDGTCLPVVATGSTQLAQDASTFAGQVAIMFGQLGDTPNSKLPDGTTAPIRIAFADKVVIALPIIFSAAGNNLSVNQTTIDSSPNIVSKTKVPLPSKLADIKPSSQLWANPEEWARYRSR